MYNHVVHTYHIISLSILNTTQARPMSQIVFLPLVYRSIHVPNQNRIEIFKVQGLHTTNIYNFHTLSVHTVLKKKLFTKLIPQDGLRSNDISVCTDVITDYYSAFIHCTTYPQHS